VETISAWVAWGGAQPLFLQIFLGLLLFLVVYTAASVALFATVIGVAWLLRSVGRQPVTLAAERPVTTVTDAAFASWIVHVAGATLIVWLVAQTLLQ
jgi:hypothetical protein